MSLLIIHGLKGMLNAANYGLHPAGDTDDSAAMLAAMQAAVAQRRRLWIPAGTYLLSSALQMPEGLEIVGPGDTAWLKGKIEPATGCTLRNLKIGITGHYFGADIANEGAFDIHNLSVHGVTFTGGPIYDTNSGDGVVQFKVQTVTSGKFYDCLFEDCIVEKSSNTCNGVSIITQCRGNSDFHGIDFVRLTIKGATRIGFEITVPDAGTEEIPITMPWHDINLLDYEVLESDHSALSLCGRPSGVADAGNYEMGHSTVRGHVHDAAVNIVNGSWGAHGIELNGCTAMTLTGNLVEGAHQRTMLDASMGVPVPTQNCANVIDGNTFDGSASATSSMSVGGKGVTFTNNSVKTRSGDTCQLHKTGESACTITGNDFQAIAADGESLDTSHAAVWVNNSTGLTLASNTFRSQRNGVVICETDWGTPDRYAVGVIFTGNTWYMNSGDTPISKDAGSSFTADPSPTYNYV